MKIQIENLRAQMRGVQLNAYQRRLALNEYYKLLDYVDELEQLSITDVSKSVCPKCGNTGRCEPRTLSDPDGQECDCGANCC